jgi:hypothetical protein
MENLKEGRKKNRIESRMTKGSPDHKRRLVAIRCKEPDDHKVVRVPDQRDCMITSGWYGDAIALCANTSEPLPPK